MSDNVITGRFGESRPRDLSPAEMLARLREMNQRYWDKVNEDPVPYLRAAGEEIMRLRRCQQEVFDAAFPASMMIAPVQNETPPKHRSLETITITKEDYDRFQAVLTVINGWLL